MTEELRKEILKTVAKGSIISMIRRGGKPVPIGPKVDDHGDSMIVLLNGIKTPILYGKLWHNKILEVEQVIAKMEDLPF